MDTANALHGRRYSPTFRIQPKNGSTLAPVVVLDATPGCPASGSFASDIPESQGTKSFAPFPVLLPAQTTLPSLPAPDEQSPGSPLERTSHVPGPTVQLRVSITIDPEHHHARLVKSKAHMVLVLTALVQTPDQRETWVEQSRTEQLTLEKTRSKGIFVKTLPLQIQEGVRVIGFTLLAVPSPSMGAKLAAAFPTLDGLVPWAEVSVAAEHFVAEAGGLAGTSTHELPHPASSSGHFSVPLMEISLAPEMGPRKRKQTIGTLSIVVEELLAYDERRVLEELEKEPGVSLSEMIQAVPLDHQPNPITRGASFLDSLRRGGARSSPAARENALQSARARQGGLSNEDSQFQKLLRQQISAHRNIEVFYQDMALKVEQKLKENLEIGQGPFRRSPEKKEESVQWVPLNCCVQDFLVQDGAFRVNYQSTTVGAAAAHGAGFSRKANLNLQSNGKAPSLSAYWEKQERGSNLVRDFGALQEVVVSSFNEFTSLIALMDNANRERIVALVKEIRFLRGEIVSFGTFLLLEYLVSLSAEGSSSFVCGEIESLIARLKQIELPDDDELELKRSQELSAPWLLRCKRSIKDIVGCTEHLKGFIIIGIQHECVTTDATLVANPDWIAHKRTRECCYSQLLATLATSFLAMVEDWWANMASAIHVLEQQQNAHRLDCKHHSSRAMGYISEEACDQQSRGQENGAPSSQAQHRRTSVSHRQNGKDAKPRRPSLRSTASRSSSASSTSAGYGRSKSHVRPPLENAPQAKKQNDVFWDQLLSLGWLVQIESLLSTQGSELGMLQDYFQAVEDIRNSVTISLHVLPLSRSTLPTSPTRTPAERTYPVDLEDIGDDTVQVSGRRGQINLSFGLDPLQFSLLPEHLKACSSKIHVWPILFSQGINEMQTLSNLTGKSSLQWTINETGLRQMQSYVSQHQAWISQNRTAQETKQPKHDKAKSRSYSLHASRAGLCDVSSASLASNMSSDWAIVTPSRAELWNGEPLVNELLCELEMAVLGHSDESHAPSERSRASSQDETDVQLSYPSPSPSESHFFKPRTEAGLGSNTSILGSMMEYGSSRLFSSKGPKEESILECAEALTRALGQIRTPTDVQHNSSVDGIVLEAEMYHRTDGQSLECQCPTALPGSNEMLPLSSLWATSHIISCKSAKDRTSMAVTLSQANLLRRCHGLQTHSEQNGEDDWQAIVDAMRSEVGVRIKNVERNLKLGEFAKDLLWISAFGPQQTPHQPPLFFVESASDASQQEPYCAPQVPDALTFMRSLLPGTAASSSTTSYSYHRGGVNPLDPNLAGPMDTTRLNEDNGAPAHSSGVNRTSAASEDGQYDEDSGAVLVGHGHPDPCAADVGQSSPGQPAPLTLLESPATQAQHQVIEVEHYTSFPGSFDEPVLAVRLARSLGLDSLARPSPSGSTSDGLAQSQSSRQIQPPSPLPGVGSTPSWSSQQSAFYQQQLALGQKTPLLARRLSSFGLGLGFISKASDSIESPNASDTSAPPRHGSVDYGQSQPSTPQSATFAPSTFSSSSGGMVGASHAGSSHAGSSDGSAATSMAPSKKGKFAFNKVQLKFLPVSYRPPERMTTNVFES
ncbi:Phosphatidylinositol 3,4,5-trisphosphate-dependent Rac exchanger 2 protein [Mortierella alpina]|nr:Phosphatidylinositol 3,4,5-trisphosphate-dependent Rac exchanger 2 protein [Mortierella alpina]